MGFVNIGRGNIITEGDIVFALDNQHFTGAVLDVFHQEPLPSDSPLWCHENVLGESASVQLGPKFQIIDFSCFSVTPHIAGESRAQDIAECFKTNLDLYDSGAELGCCIDWDKLY